ncbi:MAG: Gfo/Idh/MocA family oxidoreductase [Rhodobacteraceae bacterium]|jgi:predicted dehydrogenase|nr:Gfo/Idh/MocA family oxidoreductase [Paracoccaceae bacterium]
MRIVFAGAGHWHLPLYREPLRGIAGTRVVGVTDHDPAVARRIAAAEDCAHDSDLDSLCDRVRPDLVFVLGRHAGMARDAGVAIGRGIPLVVEKPCGMSAAEVAALAARAAAAGVFAAVPLVFRQTGFMAELGPIAAAEGVRYAGFRFFAGLPDRYRRNGCDWMLERRFAGGGVLTNLGVHFLDLLLTLLPAGASVAAASLARLGDSGDVEDYADLTLAAPGAVGRVETGYLYPAPTGRFDMHFSVRTARHYLLAQGPGRIELCDLAGNCTVRAASTTNMEAYPGFVADVLRRLREGAPPCAGLEAMARVMRLVEAAHACAGRAGTADHRQESVQ